MRKELVINGRVYTPAEITFNALCELEDMGVTMESLDTGKTFGALRAYLALCMGTDPSKAGSELEAHITGGGELGDLMECMMEAFEESGFFRALKARTEAAPATDQPTKPEKKTK